MAQSAEAHTTTQENHALHFLVIGAMRAGTTTLHDTLYKLPSLSLPRIKETDFFIESKNWPRGRKWYLSQFSGEPHRLRGEVCPNYAKRDVFPEVPGLVADTNPDVRIIYVVRDPLERALSHYRHTWLSSGDVPEPGKLDGTWAEKHILATSRYAWQMEAWLEHFRQDQILIIDFEDFVNRPLPQVQSVVEHIGAEIPAEIEQIAENNTVADVARMPRWWHSFRNTPAGIKARALAPTGLIQAVKSRLKHKDGPDVPPFPTAAKERFADALASDASAFRKLTGQAFESWSV
ncbi:MAG: sulfotransferase [Pseudomonadota bacterium]